MNAQKIVHLCGITTYLSHGKSGRGDFFFCVCVCVRLSIYHKFALVTQMTWALVVCSVTLSLCLFLLSTYSLFNALTWRFNSVCKHYIRVCVCRWVWTYIKSFLVCGHSEVVRQLCLRGTFCLCLISVYMWVGQTVYKNLDFIKIANFKKVR